MQLALIGADIVAIIVLVFGIYLPRYHRGDLMVALFGLNIGTLAVATALSSTSISAGLGLGLFGVLSIVRLRSDELGQEDVAFYFSALALGLLAGLTPDPTWVGPGLMALIVFTMFAVTRPGLVGRHQRVTMRLDRAVPDEDAARLYVDEITGRSVSRLSIVDIDYVNDSTRVEVRYRQ